MENEETPPQKLIFLLFCLAALAHYIFNLHHWRLKNFFLSCRDLAKHVFACVVVSLCIIWAVLSAHRHKRYSRKMSPEFMCKYSVASVMLHNTCVYSTLYIDNRYITAFHKSNHTIVNSYLQILLYHHSLYSWTNMSNISNGC